MAIYSEERDRLEMEFVNEYGCVGRIFQQYDDSFLFNLCIKIHSIHSNCYLTDEQYYPDFSSVNELQDHLRKHIPDICAMYPLCLYNHTDYLWGIDGSKYPFSCSRDAMIIGFVTLDREGIEKAELTKAGNGENVTSTSRKIDLYNLIVEELEMCDAYFRCDIYGYMITDIQGEIINQAWNFIGYYKCREQLESCLPKVIPNSTYIDVPISRKEIEKQLGTRLDDKTWK